MAETPIDAEHGQQTAIALPKWFVWLAGICFTVSALTIMPWVVWQTRVTMRLEIQMTSLVKIEDKLERVLALPASIQSIERRIEVLERNIQSNASVKELERIRERLNKLEEKRT